MIVSLPMYENERNRDAHDRYWKLVREALNQRGLSAPTDLTRLEAGYMDHWRRPDLLLSQTCSFPYRRHLHDKVTLVGTPDYGVEECPPGYFRSVLICRADDPRTRVEAFDGAALAFNEPGSQSGFAAPNAHARKAGIALIAAVETGSHVHSLKAIAAGKADIAAIDAVTWRDLLAIDPDVSCVRELERTTPTPGLPYVTAYPDLATALFEALAEAIAGLTSIDRASLGLRQLVPISKATYLTEPDAADTLAIRDHESRGVDGHR